MRLPEHFPEQTVKKMVASEIESVIDLRFRRGTRKAALEGFYYRKAFRGDNVMECLVLKKLGLTAREMLRP